MTIEEAIHQLGRADWSSDHRDDALDVFFHYGFDIAEKMIHIESGFLRIQNDPALQLERLCERLYRALGITEVARLANEAIDEGMAEARTKRQRGHDGVAGG